MSRPKSSRRLTEDRFPDLSRYWESSDEPQSLNHLLTIVALNSEPFGLDRKDPAYGVLLVLVAAQRRYKTLYISHAKIAKKLGHGTCTKTVKRALAHLEHMGYIEITPQKHPYKGYANGYSVTPLATRLGLTWGGEDGDEIDADAEDEYQQKIVLAPKPSFKHSDPYYNQPLRPLTEAEIAHQTSHLGRKRARIEELTGTLKERHDPTLADCLKTHLFEYNYIVSLLRFNDVKGVEPLVLQ